MINSPGSMLLKKIDPSPSSYQGPLAPELGVGLCTCLPSPALDVVGMELVQTSARSPNRDEFICAAVLVRLESTFLVVISTREAPTLIPVSFSADTRAWEERMWCGCPF